MIRILRSRSRVGAATAAALLVLLGPAALPAWGTPTTSPSVPTTTPSPSSGAAPSSAGSPTSATPTTASSASAPTPSWQPPPLGGTPLPADSGRPDKPYTTGSQSCILSGVGNTTITDEPPPQSMLDIKTAQQLSKGAGVTVAVIDTGVNPHRYLADRLHNGGDYILGDNNALVDCDGHGTIVAGIIAANTAGQGVGFTGVAPQADILAIKQTSEVYTAGGGGQGAGDITTLAEAIVHAANTPGVRVITMSVDNCMLANSAVATTLASPTYQQLHKAIDYAVNTKDDVVIAAAGNLSSTNSNTDQNGQQQSACQGATQNNNPDINQVNQLQVPPVYSDDVLSVASVNPVDGSVSSFSVWGPWVSVAAPGEQITSLDPGAGGVGLSNQTTENNQNVSMQGTSFAAPYVAGLAALVRARFPQLTARQVMERIEVTAQHPSGPGGRNNQVGYGLINPVAALTAVIPGQNGMPSDIASGVQIPAQLPGEANGNAVAVRVALVGAAIAAGLLVGIAFVVNIKRRNPTRRDEPEPLT